MTTYERLKNLLVEDYQLPPEELTPDVRLDALGVDSLGVMELLFKVEDEFHIKVPLEQAELITVNDLAHYIEQLKELKAGQEMAGAASKAAS